MPSSWPPVSTGPGTGFTVNTAFLDGRPTTIAWGTDFLYEGVIVKSMRSSRMIEEIRIENGTGLTATQILLNDGDQVEITVIDDRSIDFPDSGETISLLNPIDTASSLSNPADQELFIVVNNDYNAARKVEGDRVLLCKRYILDIPHAVIGT
jgi:hypothetical protein